MNLTDLKEISLLVGIWVAIYGIDSWRRAHIGKRRIELAEETLALFYEARDVLSSIRSPLSYETETENVERLENESDLKYKCRKQASVVYVRYNKNKDVFNKIHSLRYRFMAQIGKNEAKPFDELNRIVRQVLSSADRLAHLWSREYFRDEKDQKEHSKTVEEQETIFWDRLDDTDPISPKMNKVITDIETTCKKIISGQGTLYGILNRPLIKKG